MNHWNYVALSDICTVERGGSPRPIDNFITTESDGINWIKIGDTDESMYITKTAQKIKPEGMKKSRYVKPGDFLLSNSMSFGRPYILKIDGCIHDGWLVLRDVNNVFDKKFLYYYLSAPITYEKFKSMAVGGVVNNLNSDMVRKIRVPLPSKQEQRDIADSLDKITNLHFLRKQQLVKLDELVKTRFVEMFGDPVNNPMNYPKSQLGKVCDVRDGTHDSPEYYDVGYPLVTSKNVTGGKIDLSECNLISEDDYKKICERSKVDRGDIIMPMIGTVGKPVIVNIEPMFAIKNVALIKFTPDSLVTNIYIKTLLESDYFDRAVLDKIRGGTQKFIALGDIRKLEIILPDLKHQQCFSAFVERVDQQKQTVQQSLEKLELMKKALMQEYFG